MAFWQEKTLEQMSVEEFEALCDGCGKCCLNKVIDDDTEQLYFTDVACKLLDNSSGGCRDYANRFIQVPDCVKVDPADAESFLWLPPSCAYRRVQEGRDLPSWHPLLTGSKAVMHRKRMSVKGRSVSEERGYSLVERICSWPLHDRD